MKAVILAGGLGTRLAEETSLKPKPMVEIGGKPILWHIMKIYSHHGINDFIICLGYKGSVIKEYFSNYFINNSNVTFDIRKNEIEVHQNNLEPWRVTLVDTGDHSMTGGRLKRLTSLLKDENDFCFTYGDGVSDVNITKLIEFHRYHGKLATLTAVNPPGRFGALDIKNDDNITMFLEKPSGDGRFVNGGYFVLSPKVLEYISHDQTTWEDEPLRTLANEGNLKAFKHDGFWQPMDTIRDKNYLQELWDNNNSPWKVWS